MVDGIEVQGEDDPMGSMNVEETVNARENGDDEVASNAEEVGRAERRRILQEECQKRPYLDGRYFSVDLESSTRDGLILATCMTCNGDKKFKGSLAAPSNFTTHLKRIHPEVYEQYKVYKETKRILLRNENPQPRIRMRASCIFSQEEFETNVANYILKSMAPLSTVEMPAFRKIFDDLEITVNHVALEHLTRRTLGRRIKNIHTQNMDELRRVIAEKATFVCTTADIWTSRNRKFLGVTAHWIDRVTLQRKSAAMACRRFPGTHSHANIARCLSDIHVSFGLIAPKLCATVTDNGTNFVNAFREFGVDLPDLFFYETVPEVVESQDDDESPDDNQNVELLEDRASFVVSQDDFTVGLPQHLRCASHTLNLIATTDTMNIINDLPQLAAVHSEAISRCTLLWKALRSSKNFEQMREQLGVALLRPIVTRWNSLYDAISQIVSLKGRIAQVSATVGIQSALRDNDFIYLEEYLLCMKPVAEAIDSLQGETYCYYGYLLPILVTVRKGLSQLRTDEHIQHCQPLVEGLMTALERRFESFFTVDESSQNAAIAAVSHPKFKTRWLSCLDASTQGRVRNLVLRAATAAQNAPVQPMEEEDDYYDFGQLPAPQKAAVIFGYEEAEIELLRYSNNPNTDLSMLQEFPIMRSVFLKYNTPLPSSAPVEKLFSFATMMNLPRYNRLTHFEQRVLSKANAKKLYL